MRKYSSPEAYQLVHDGARALAQVEANGVRIDVDHVEKTIKKMTHDIARQEERAKQSEVWKTWRKVFGTDANLDSRKQLGDVLFDHMGLEGKLKGSEDRWEADELALEETAHPFALNYIKLSKLKKILTSYLLPLQRETTPERLMHCFYNLHSTLTYRSSADGMAIQTIPIRNKRTTPLIRKAFIPHEEDHHFVEIDFSGAEVKVAASYTKDPRLIRYILDKDTDMHRDMAAELFMLQPDQITKATRQSTKGAFVFAQFYGDWYIACAQSLWAEIKRFKLKTADGVCLYDHLAANGITEMGACIDRNSHTAGTFERHVMRVEKGFWKQRFKVYDKWKEDWYANYLKTGGFSHKTGIYIEGLYSRNHVNNNPIQGSSFHCLLWCIIRMQKWLRRHKMRSKLVLQVHDSMGLSVHKDEKDDVLAKAKQIMTVDLAKSWKWLQVPMEIEAEVAPLGGSWNDKQEVEI